MEINSTQQVFKIASQYNSVLEVGCGEGYNLNKISAPVKVGIDGFRPVMMKNKSKDIVFIKFDLESYLQTLFLPNSFECIIGIDIIEHFDKSKAIELIEDWEKIASKCLMFFVPVGNHPQTEDDRGLGNDYYQTHRSTWFPEDMRKLNYDVTFHPNWHKNPNKDTGAMFCYKKLGG